MEHAKQIPEVVSNLLFFGILEGLCTDYSVFEQQPIPRRRSRSPQEQQLCLILGLVFIFVVFL